MLHRHKGFTSRATTQSLSRCLPRGHDRGTRVREPGVRNLETFDGRWLIERDDTGPSSGRVHVGDMDRPSSMDCCRDEFVVASEELRAHLAVVVDHLGTIETITDYIDESYEHAIDLREPLPVAVAEPGPLIARVIRLAGPNGITRQRLLDIFHLVGKERVQRGLDTMLAGGAIQSHVEQRPSATGREQRQTVYR